MNQDVPQLLSCGKRIRFSVGDKPYSPNCDYMKSCEYKCLPVNVLNKNNVTMDTYSEQFIVLNNEKIIERIKQIYKEKYVLPIKLLIQEINAVRNYPLVQIYSSLTDIIKNKIELMDKYNRTGVLINIGELYFFKPIELTSNNQVIYNLEHPVEFKRERLNINIPLLKDKFESIEKIIKKIEEDKPVEREKEHKLLKNMKINFENSKKEQKSLRGIENWYILSSNVRKLLSNMGYSERSIDLEIVSHNIDMLNFNEQLELINFIYRGNDDLTNNDFRQLVKRVLDKRVMTHKGKLGILVSNNNINKLIVRKEADDNDKSVWKLGEMTDNQAFEELINERKPKIEKLNRIVGFITEFKNTYSIFKVKDLKDKRSKGARCDQAGKSTTIKLINNILDKEMMTTENTKDMVQLELCVVQELILRLLNREKKDSKVWFLNNIDSNLLQIEKLSI